MFCTYATWLLLPFMSSVVSLEFSRYKICQTHYDYVSPNFVFSFFFFLFLSYLICLDQDIRWNKKHS